MQIESVREREGDRQSRGVWKLFEKLPHGTWVWKLFKKLPHEARVWKLFKKLPHDTRLWKLFKKLARTPRERARERQREKDCLLNRR